MQLSYPDYEYFRDHNRAFAEMALRSIVAPTLAAPAGAPGWRSSWLALLGQVGSTDIE